MALRLKSFEVPDFPRAEYKVVVEPVHGGAFVTITDKDGTVLERCSVAAFPGPDYFYSRIVRWSYVMLKQILRIHFVPVGGWEALEAATKASWLKNKKRPAEPQA